MQTCLCEYLSPEGGNRPDGVYGIGHTSIQGDPLEDKVLTAYVFLGEPINCSKYPGWILISKLTSATALVNEKICWTLDEWME